MTTCADFHLIWPASNWRPKKLEVAIAFLRKNLMAAHQYTDKG
ncbi:hypothetical protein [Paracoccus albus]|nr:hypothetical protein [Paracoccus albus]WBU62288.1 hypothetical protein PAF20_17905 [Paracoccus albus]